MLHIREITAADAEAWAQLLALAFNRPIDQTRSLWPWLHTGFSCCTWGAWDGPRLVAQYTSLVARVRLPSREGAALAGVSTAMAVHPSYRGRGLIRQVAQPVYAVLQASGCVAGVGFSNAAGVQVDRHSKGYGYQVVGRLRSVLLVPQQPATCPGLSLSTTWPALPWEATPDDDDCVRFEATPATLHHRYAQHPFRRYRFGTWAEDGKILGMVVDRPISMGGVRGSALLAAAGCDLPELMRRWVAGVRLEGAQFVRLLVTPRSPLLAAIRPLGLCSSLPYCRLPHYLTVKPLLQDAGPLLDIQRWDCAGGDVL